MCGIVGLFLKHPDWQSRLGQLFTPMLEELEARGPDSSGAAFYSYSENPTWKVSLQHHDDNYDWEQAKKHLETRGLSVTSIKTKSLHCTMRIEGEEATIRRVLNELPVSLMSIGKRMEIYKAVGTPREVARRFDFAGMVGSHAIGHTRMATESEVTTEGSHPFSTGGDTCLVHNGSISNYHLWRKRLAREGVHMQTMNDTEVAAGYLAWRLSQGNNLEGALQQTLEDIDGTYTLAVSTADEFAVLRDRTALKPAVIVETDYFVAMASEYRCLALLPGADKGKTWEPEPSTVYTWKLHAN